MKSRSGLIRTLLITLLFVISLSSLAFAAKSKSKKKTVNLTVGQSTTIKAGKKAKWSVKGNGAIECRVASNKKSASVTGKNQGTGRVIFKAGKKTVEYTFNVSGSEVAGSTAATAAAAAPAAAQPKASSSSTEVLQSGDTAGMTSPEAAAYQKMLGMAGSYPEGRGYDNSTYYAWHGGGWPGGYGCAGFAFMLSDKAFGTNPATKSKKEAAWIHVGDILIFDFQQKTQHVVIVMKKKSDCIVVAEGNYHATAGSPGVVHWGRKITYSEALSADFILSRYLKYDSGGTVLQ